MRQCWTDSSARRGREAVKDGGQAMAHAPQAVERNHTLCFGHEAPFGITPAQFRLSCNIPGSAQYPAGGDHLR